MNQQNKILVIEDDKNLGLNLKLELETLGFVVDHATNGKKARELINIVNPNLVLLDLKLPDADGIELLGEFKELYPCIEFIIVTARSSIKNVKTALNQEAFVYVEKPFEISYLTTLIKRALEKQRLKVELKQSDNKYRTLFDISPSSIIITDLKGVVVDYNKSTEEIFGFKKEELVNNRNPKAHPFISEILSLVAEIKDTVLKDKLLKPKELSLHKKDSSLIWTKVIASILPIEEYNYIQLVIKDITQIISPGRALEELEKTICKINALNEIAPIAIFVLTQNGKILRANKACEGLFKYTQEEFLNLEIFDLFQPISLEFVKKHYNDDFYNPLEQKKIEAIGRAKNNESRYVEITSVILRTEDHILIQSFISDITERVMLEKNRVNFLKKIQASLDFKSKFLAEMSHELRTPLNAILGFSQLLLDKNYGNLNEDQLDFLNDIISAGDHLLSLINSILDISKIEAGKLELNSERLNLQKLTKSIINIIKPLYKKKNLEFHTEGLDDNTFIYTDSLRFRQILFNLFSNAIKFTDTGTVSLIFEENSDEYIFKIKDTGIGIDEKDFYILFSEFGRVKNSEIAANQGAGLGLALSKQLIELQGGRIWFDSKLGKGSTFYFTIAKD